MATSENTPAATDPAAIWPGNVTLDRKGARIALDLLIELDSIEDDGSCICDQTSIDHSPRQGRPFRNMVAEYAGKAQSVGPEALEAFYAILGDYIGSAVGGCVPDIDVYTRYCGEDSPT
jgi:hypothetical protein